MVWAHTYLKLPKNNITQEQTTRKAKKQCKNNLTIQYVSVSSNPVDLNPVDIQSNQDEKNTDGSLNGKDLNEHLVIPW